LLCGLCGIAGIAAWIALLLREHGGLDGVAA
jgi:hypothetical protein